MKNQIGIIGISGRMGKAIEEELIKHPHFELYKGIHLANSDEKNEVASKSEILIDFSTPASLETSIEAALHYSKPLVVGTTGLETVQLKLLEAASQRIPLFYSPNFSLGILAIRQTLLSIIKNLGKVEKIEIIDIHHKNKKDAPSGTALYLSKLIETIPLAIHSIRENDLVGEHRIILHCQGETVTLSHQVHSRAVFAKGALLCAKWLLKQPPGLYENIT